MSSPSDFASNPATGGQPTGRLERPLAIYLVAFWSFFVMTLFTNFCGRWIAWWLANGHPTKENSNVIVGILTILLFWHVVRLVQLRSFNRWLTVGLVGLVTASTVWKAVGLAYLGLLVTRGAVATMVFLALSLLCIWYLSRRSFRAFAVDYVSRRTSELHARAMQKASLKRTQFGARR